MLKKLPKVQLANLPTPLHEAKNLAKHLKGPRIFFKRDDATGRALGGQKTRMFEYPLGDALAKGADVIVTTGMEDANFSSQLIACVNMLGLETVMVFYKKISQEMQGNALLINLLDPITIETEIERDELGWEIEDNIDVKLNEVVNRLKNRGLTPYKLDYGPLCQVGFFYCAQEIMGQLQDMEETAQYLYVAHASGSVQGGLVLGAKYFQAPFKIIGTLTIPGHTKEVRAAETAQRANLAANYLGADIKVTAEEIVVRDEYIGPERWGLFAKATQKSVEAIRLVAKTEGVFLDPHYTGKAMAALLDDIEAGKYSAQDTIIFYLTGGAPNIFSYPGELKIHSRRSIEDMRPT